MGLIDRHTESLKAHKENVIFKGSPYKIILIGIFMLLTWFVC